MAVNLEPGMVVFGHRIERLLGRGGMGTVYLARQLSLAGRWRSRCCNWHLLRQEHAVEDFLREARAAARLNHPHLVICHDAHADADQSLYCYSMEYVPGRSVGETMRTSGVLTRQTALHLTYQIASALGCAHSHGLVHRDVKPDNIIITSGAAAKLVDLGLARDRLGGDTTTASGMRLVIVGTPEFSSPEQGRTPHRTTAASDVFSLGATLWYMLCGKPPFQGETVIDLIVRAQVDPLEFNDKIPEDCHRLLELMMAKDPEDRLPNGGAVVAALEAMAQGRQVELPPREGDDEVASTVPGQRQRRQRRLRRFR